MAAGERILVVDDNAQNLKLVSILLDSEGYDVHTATDAESAMASISKLSPQLVLMDVQLPGMDGLELTRRLKADPVLRHVLVIALTANAMKSDEDRAMAAGCDAYVTKPLDLEGLARTVEEVLSRVRR